jgi:chromosome segregation ATPase
LKLGGFRIIIGAAAETVYNIHVQCRYASAALPVLDELIVAAKQRQQRLPNILHEIDEIEETQDLSERKLIVVEAMVAEAEARTHHWQEEVMKLNELLEEDNELMTMSEDEREKMVEERDYAESDFYDWTNLLSSRLQEKDDIAESVETLKRDRLARLAEKDLLKVLDTLYSISFPILFPMLHALCYSLLATRTYPAPCY